MQRGLAAAYSTLLIQCDCGPFPRQLVGKRISLLTYMEKPSETTYENANLPKLRGHWEKYVKNKERHINA